jgi:hypothetical protein
MDVKPPDSVLFDFCLVKSGKDDNRRRSRLCGGRWQPGRSETQMGNVNPALTLKMEMVLPVFERV